MNTLGGILIGIQVGFLLLAAILIGGSFGGFLGGGYMITAAILVIVFWGTFAAFMVYSVRLAYLYGTGRSSENEALTWANGLFKTVSLLAPATGLFCALGAFVGCGPLYLSSLYHWGGLVGFVLGLAAVWLLPVIVRACGENSSYEWGWWWILYGFQILLLVAYILVWPIAYLVLKGDINLADYKPANHVYRLPFPGGEDSWVIQGNNSNLDHNNDPGHFQQKFSWDFRRRCGTPVLASRDGTIQLVTDSHDSFGSNDPNNEVRITQSDGNTAFYLHIQKGSVPAHFRPTGTVVHQGDQIALAGCVGISLTGHIHFMVRSGIGDTGPTIGVSFVDVTDDNGIPRTFGSYTSGNRMVH
jgi:hypothetical protein